MDVRFSFVLVLVLVDGVCGLSECQTLQNRAIALFWHQKDFLPDHIETSKYQNIPIYAFRNSTDETICVKIYAHGSHLTFLTVILKHPVLAYSSKKDSHSSKKSSPWLQNVKTPSTYRSEVWYGCNYTC